MMSRIEIQKLRSWQKVEYIDIPEEADSIEPLQSIMDAAGFKTVMLFGTRNAMVVQIGDDCYRVRVIPTVEAKAS
jgi:hypothetical protein